MRNKRIFLALLVFNVTFSNVQAANYSYLIGGGGEASLDYIFENDVHNLNYINKFTQNQRIYFDGGHPVLEKRINATFPNAEKSKFYKKDYNKFLKDLLNDLKKGKIKSGDQVLITIATHGAAMNSKVKSHEIALKTKDQKGLINLFNLDGAEVASLDDMKNIIELAEKNGVKLGIIDQSCYGGATAYLAKGLKNVCVLAGSSERSPNVILNTGRVDAAELGKLGLTKSSMDSFSEALNKKDTNLEEVYLYALDNTHAGVTPVNSVSMFDKLEKKLIDELSPYVDLYGVDNAIKKSIANDTTSICEADFEINKVFKEVESFLKNDSVKSEYKKFELIKNEYLTKKKDLYNYATQIDEVQQMIMNLPPFNYSYIDITGKEIHKSQPGAGVVLTPQIVKEYLKELSIVLFKNEVEREAFYLKNSKKLDELNKQYLAEIDQKFPGFSLGDTEKANQLASEFYKSSVKLMNGINQIKKATYLSNLDPNVSNACRDFKIP